ncbi:MAG TPA: hypothetical protein VFQ92_25015, partial [Blastocatellia bacterium]|nr:hypothetical protein [Blastocatellia bacterium]
MREADLLLKNGTIIDGTGRPRSLADVAIKDGLIAAIDKRGSLDATRSIDCSGLIIAPGFIDTHS